MGGSTPVLTPGKTPIGTPAMNMATPTPGINSVTVLYPQDLCNDKYLPYRLLQKFVFSVGHIMSMTPEQLQAWRWEREIDERNRPLSDEELDAMFPEGYKVITWNMTVLGFRIQILF